MQLQFTIDSGQRRSGKCRYSTTHVKGAGIEKCRFFMCMIVLGSLAG